MHAFSSSTIAGLPSAAVQELYATVSKDEVWLTLSHIGSLKAPGPEGFHAFFFKQLWHIVGEYVWGVVRDAFTSSAFDLDLAQTLICLIPKVDVPTSFKEFIPIGLCNVLYKLITKVLVNRLRPFLQELIGPLHSSFIHGRATVDNAIVIQEIVHFMNQRIGRSKNAVFKLDFEKAYGRAI